MGSSSSFLRSFGFKKTPFGLNQKEYDELYQQVLSSIQAGDDNSQEMYEKHFRLVRDYTCSGTEDKHLAEFLETNLETLHIAFKKMRESKMKALDTLYTVNLVNND